MLCWVDDALVDDARVSVLDHGLTVGDGVFETLKVVDGIPFALGRHLARLQRSAHRMGLPPIDVDAVSKAVAETVAANTPVGPGRVRITVTSGDGPLGSDRGTGPATLVVLAVPQQPWAATTSALVVPWRRNERSALVDVKSTSYAENVVALAHAHAAGFSEALLLDTRGFLSEGTGTNVFLVRGGQVATPGLDCGPLQGVTRELVIEWSRDAGIDVDQARLTLADLASADEVFLTSSTRDVHPVTRLAVEETGLELELAAGPVTARIADIFRQRSIETGNP